MLTDKEVSEIREHLEKAQNPLFLFDNDQDGLCSFLLLQRYIDRGKGVPIKSFPELDADYFRKIKELDADYVFILDKPVISEKFWKEIEQVNIPVVWIDHHEKQGEVPEFVNYYNPIYSSKTTEPVSALCYQVSQKKEDMWIATVGCISDKFLPEFYKDFLKKYPDLGIKTENAFDVFYKSEIGKIGKLMGAGLKDKTTNVISMLKFLMKSKTPNEVLEESSGNYLMHKRFKQLNEKYQRLLEKAIEENDPSKEVLFFQYGGDLSISGEISNELSYKFPNKFIVVMYIKGAKANISGRGKNIREKLLKTIEGIEGARGGGHENAVGAQVKVEDIEMFRKRFLEIMKNQ